MTWDDLPVGCVISNLDNVVYIKRNVHGGHTFWLDGRNLFASSGMSGRKEFPSGQWTYQSFIPKEFLE